MSLDFPNREDWLAIRKAIPAPWHYVHRSTSGIRHTAGYQFSTFNVGRNKAKRLKRKAMSI